MPYITRAQRDLLATGIPPSHPGELNYAITKMLVQYIDNHGLSYHVINDILGALEGAKLEFYRRVVVPYENTKLALNGDVYNAPQ